MTERRTSARAARPGKVDRRSTAARIPDVAALVEQLSHHAPPCAVPLLYIEFGRERSSGQHGQDADTHSRLRFRAACKQATAAALKSAVGSILRRGDAVAAGRGGEWFVAALLSRRLDAAQRPTIDADLGLAAQRLRRSVQRALERQAAETAVGPLALRSGWNVLELTAAGDAAEALRHAIRGAALLARVEEHRGVVLASVNHELRTPLTAVIGFCERLREKHLTERQRSRFVALIDREANRLQRLTEGLIDVGAWNAGGLQLHRERRSLRAVALDAARTVAPQARHRSVAVRVQGTAQAPVDADRLKQVLINLLDNAIRHTPQSGRVSVRITEHGAAARIEVHDDGDGFAAAASTHVSAPFATGPKGNVGLGLAIASVLVEAHGGRMDYGQGAGSTGGMVRVTLPLEDVRRPRTLRAGSRFRAGPNTRL